MIMELVAAIRKSRMLPGMLVLWLLVSACGTKPDVPPDASVGMHPPQESLASFSEDEAPAMTASVEASAPIGQNGTPALPDAKGVISGRMSDDSADDAETANQTEQEILAAIFAKVERYEPLTTWELERYREYQRLVAIREKQAQGEELTATEWILLGEANKRMLEAEKNEKTTPSKVPTPKPTSPPAREADWAIRVDDTVTLEMGELTWRMNLYVSMDKLGGKDPGGAYQGKLLLTAKVDEADLLALLEEDAELIVDTMAQSYTVEAVSATIEVIPFDAGGLKSFAEEHLRENPSVPVESASWMALDAPEMITRYQVSMTGHDVSGNEGWGSVPDAGRKAAVPVRILVRGAEAEVCFGQMNAFKGTLIGTVK